MAASPDEKVIRLGRIGQALVTEGVEASQAATLVRSLVRETKPSVREAALDDRLRRIGRGIARTLRIGA